MQLKNALGAALLCAAASMAGCGRGGPHGSEVWGPSVARYLLEQRIVAR
jgi:hypothetical protein